MNKSLRYLIFALLLIGIGYAIYHLMNKPVVKLQEISTVAKEDSVDKNVAQPEEAKPAETAVEVKVEQKQEVKPEEVKAVEVKKEEINKDVKQEKK